MSTYYLISPPGDELYHHGIKGQKWGIRRFQPYRQGMKVLGGKVVGAAKKVKQRFTDAGEAHKKKKAVKKAQATKKAKVDFETQKKKALESGTAEDLAKLKGKLTNEEYQAAFRRLENEAKVAKMVQDSTPTIWDKVDKGMAIVQKLGGYANTIATAKENFTKMDKAFNGEKNEDAKKAKDSIAEKERMNAYAKVESVAELDKAFEKYGGTLKEYNDAVNILANKKAKEGQFKNDGSFVGLAKSKDKAVDGTWTSDEMKQKSDNVKKNASYDNSDPKDFKAPPKTLSEKAGYKNPDGETGYTSQSVESGKRVISGFKKATGEPVSYNSAQTLSFGESTVRRLSASAPKSSQVKQDMAPTAEERDRATRMANVRAAYSVNKNISGAKTGQAGTTYKQQTDLSFGDKSVKKFSAKAPEPSKIVTDTRKTVADTQAESARQKEIDEKRKKALGR